VNEQKPLLPPEVAIDLSNCDREPIHIPSLSQPHGVVLAARMSDMRIVYTSENSMDVLGVVPEFILRSTLQQVLGQEVVSSIEHALGLEERLLVDIMISKLPAYADTRFDIFAHRTGNLLCVELQLASGERRWNLLSTRLTKTINHLGQPETPEALFESIPPLIRNLTGYDRVMVYRFDVDGHGEVIAEAKDPAMEPFLGLHYPATDIPAQARELYRLQRIRTIVDVGYKPVRILANPELALGQSFDMTYCCLRSVSPIHIEYLQNMGVAASLGLSLIHEGELWGLVICHHRTTKRPSPETLALCSLLGQHISLLLGATLQAGDRAEHLEKALLIDVMSAAAEGERSVDDIRANDAATLALMRADGALIRLNGEARLMGNTPSLAEALALMQALHPRLEDGIVSTRAVGALLPQFDHLAAVASGVLMISFDDLGDGIVWFRGEIAQTVRWAGKPDATKVYYEGSYRLGPRKSFAAWEVVQHGRSLPWRPREMEAARKLQIGIARSLLHRAAEAAIEASNQIGAINESQMVIEFTMDGTILRVNDNVLRRFGYDAADLEGKDHSILLPKEDQGSARQREFWAGLRQGKFQTGEFKRITADGREVWVDVRYNPILGKDGLPVKILAFATDETERVTNRIENEGRIRDNEARLQVIVDNVMAGIIVIDQAGVIASINAAGLRMFGYQADEAIGQNVRILIPESDRDKHDAHMARYESTGEPKVIGVGRELEGLKKDGRLFPLDLTVNEVSFGGGRMFVGMIRDITERKQVEKERQRQEEVLRTNQEFLEQTGRIAGVGGWELDLATENAFWSPATRRLFGIDEAYVLTLHSVIDLFVPADRPALGAAVARAIADGTGFDLENELIRGDGTRIWVRSVGSVEYAGGKPIRLIGACQDTTAQVAERLALLRASQRATLAADSGRIGIWEWDIATNTLTADAWMYRLYGMEPDISQAFDLEFWSGRVHREDWAAVQQGLEDCLEGIRDFEAEFRIAWDDGSLHHMRATGKVTRRQDGRVVRMVGTDWDITERKQREEELRKSASFLEQTGRLAGVGGWELDLPTGKLTWAAETYRILGAPLDLQPTLEQAFDLYTPESRPLIIAAMEKSTAGGGAWDLELLLRGVDGRLFWARVVGTAEFEGGKPVRLRGAFQDISERVAELRELERTRELLGLAVESGATGIWDFDLCSKELIWDSQMYRLYGGHAELGAEELYRFWLSHLHPEDRGAVEQALRDGIEGIRPYDTEFRIVWDDGSLHYIKATGKMICDQDGVALRMVGANSDITPRKQAEEDLRISNENVEMLFRGVKDYANLMLDLDGRVMTWTASAENIKGYRAEDILGCHFSRFYTPEDVAIGKPAKQLLTAMKMGRSEDTGWRVRKDGSRFWANVVITPLFDAQGKQRGYGKVTRDITSLKLAEDALRQANAVEREATQKAEDANHAKSDFLANMSHEIRTPMNAIMGMTYLALAANPVAEQRVFLTKISNAADSLLTIINDILDLSKMEANKMEVENTPFLLQEVLDNVRDVTIQVAREKGIALIFPYATEMPHYLQGDPGRLGQILINLVNNAVKFTPSGEVIVKVTVRMGAGDTMRIKFSVTDTGIGMTDAQVSKLFQAFNQADASTTRKYGGTGLGLAISKQLCELMGSSLQVESELGKGSTFFFTVNLNKATAPQASTNRIMREGVENKSVLVVDDSEHARDVLVAMLRANGFGTQEANSGEQALSLLVDSSDRGKPFDLVLLDWKMPGMNGVEVSRRIKMQLKLSRIPAILIISAFEREDVMGRGNAFDADGLLIKPVTEALLIDSIARIFGMETSGKEIPPSQALANQTANLAGRRVLLVEDNEINVDLATALLERLGIVVSVAVNGREGVDRVVAEPFDLVLMDIQMPVMDGLSATMLIRGDSRYRDLPIIAMTANAMRGDRERSLSAGMNDHLTKPINPKLLTKILLRYIPQRLPGSDNLDTAPTSEQPRDGLPDQLPPFDIPAALERTGDSALLRKMLLKFFGQYGDAGLKLREHLAAGRLDEALRLVHSLKGTAATLEARDLAAAALAMEPALRTGQTAELGPLMDTMEKALDIAIAAVSVLDRRGSTPKAARPVATSPGKRPRILVVDDELSNFDLLNQIFLSDHYDVLWADEGTKALEMVRRERPDLVLLDVMMPGMDGYEVCRRLSADPLTRGIPVIFLTCIGDQASEAKGVGLGAVDYITKPINAAAVKARVDNQIKLKWEREKAALAVAEESRIRIEDEIKRATAIDQINKQDLQLKDDFLSHVSHELRSPLTAIYSFSTIIADGLAGDTTEEQKQYLAIILKNVTQLQAMVEDLLQVTQSATGKLSIDARSVPVRGVVLDALQTMQGAAGAKIINFSYHLADDLGSAYVDPTRLLQVLIILMDNAVKFTPVCGEVKVQAGLYSKAPGLLLFEVSDNGCGIDPAKADSIFKHLYQITETGQAGRKGLGLGLHIAKDLVNRQGGEIWVESTPPHGSQFFFTVPRYEVHA
jgi:PAS domain S-box-containing protein